MSTTPLRIFVIGGHGKVAIHFTRLAVKAGHSVVSQIRNADHASDLPSSEGNGKVEPVVESLEALSIKQLSDLLVKHGPNVVLFSAGAGGKGGAERTIAVDRDGAIKVFDALEQSKLASDKAFRRLLLVSAVDVRDTEHTKPDWYNNEDFKTSKRMRDTLGPYMQAKCELNDVKKICSVYKLMWATHRILFHRFRRSRRQSGQTIIVPLDGLEAVTITRRGCGGRFVGRTKDDRRRYTTRVGSRDSSGLSRVAGSQSGC